MSTDRILPAIDPDGEPVREVVTRGGRLELGGTSGQDRRPHGGLRVHKAEHVHQSGRRLRRAMARLTADERRDAARFALYSAALAHAAGKGVGR